MLIKDVGFTAVDVGAGTDDRWAGLVQDGQPRAATWITPQMRTSDGERAAKNVFAAHMPELVPVLHQLSAGTPEPGAIALLTQVGLRPWFAACTQAAVDGVLLRNYDYDPARCDRKVVRSDFLRPVIGTGEVQWGLLDGTNDAGLAVSLTFGGRFVHGPGFAAPIVLRYLLETCDSVPQAVAALRRLPIATAQNLTLVDGDQALTVHVGPDMTATVAPEPIAANHQLDPVPRGQEAFTRTHERLAAVRAATGATGDRVSSVLRALLRQPLYQARYAECLGTVYTAVYRPAEGRVTYHWPGEAWEQSFATFEPGVRRVDIGLPDRC
ncbi:C45 family autoproteolytic acyltransferase/hydrolase [Kitasatospora sp. NPDC101235]|uniref:C45 family autoproteolytic acyltransferase/hydolase n=1 Tax=Kitasatospora sp. NPDC101235 TaxID=3364101 RepID=UPI00381DE943